jgi:hypothetical protein
MIVEAPYGQFPHRFTDVRAAIVAGAIVDDWSCR